MLIKHSGMIDAFGLRITEQVEILPKTRRKKKKTMYHFTEHASDMLAMLSITLQSM